MKNENVIEDMIDILLQLHKYVPLRLREVINEVTQQSVVDDILHEVLLGGDQLTCKRAESAGRIVQVQLQSSKVLFPYVKTGTPRRYF